ncbi:MAG: hypothetical protein V2I34_05135, partial [Bacteroidales bacterium]|nr:hypothetical protein [Bacteroidales bacterium]
AMKLKGMKTSLESSGGRKRSNLSYEAMLPALHIKPLQRELIRAMDHHHSSMTFWFFGYFTV